MHAQVQPSTPSADNTQANNGWKTSQIGRAWPEAMWQADSCSRDSGSGFLLRGHPTSFSVGELIVQAPVGSDQHISNCCSEGAIPFGSNCLLLAMPASQLSFCQRKDQPAFKFIAAQ